MHATPTPHADFQPQITLMLAMANRLDQDAVAMLFAHRRRFRIVLSTRNLEEAASRVVGLAPDVIVLDPAIGPNAIRRVAAALSRNDHGQLLVLDSRVHEGRLIESVRTPSTSYYTRSTSGEHLADVVRAINARGERLFDPALDHRVLRTPVGLQLRVDSDEPSILQLTTRELEVMRYISLGFTVRQCADKLSLSISTIDNHKSRLMKKLRLGKSQHLTRRAIRDGLIDP
ncbi:MAG: response regulator transcription factor [Planctomycetota bacterium]